MPLMPHLRDCPVRWHGTGDRCHWCLDRRQKLHDRLVLAVVVGLALCSLWAMYFTEAGR